MCYRFIVVQRFGAAHRVTRANDRGCIRNDEFDDDADVGGLWCVLFGAAVSRSRATNNQSASVDRGDRRAACEHAARRELGTSRSAVKCFDSLADGVFHAGPKAFSLAIRSAFYR